MSGYFLAALMWYAVTTAAVSAITARYDEWIDRAHDPEAQDATRRVVPTSLLVVAGVAGVELYRLVRMFPLVAVAMSMLDLPWWGAALVVAFLLVDGISIYLAAGIPMIRGDLHREAEALEEAEAIRERSFVGTVVELRRSVDGMEDADDV